MSRNTPPHSASRADPAKLETAAERSAEARQRLAAGLDFHRKGALEQADSLYQEALGIEISADALHLRGMVAHQLGRHADGESFVRSAIELEPGNFAFHSNLGETLRAQGRIDEAITAYQDALAIDPRFVDALGNLALALAGEGRFAEALPYAQRACAISTTDFEPFMVCGDLFRQLSKYQEALAAYDQVLRLRPNLLEAWVNGGLSLIVLNQNEQALEYFQRALALDARSPRAATGLGLALFQLHRLEEAQDSLELALRVAPGDPDALVALARVRRRQRRHQEAIELVQRALERDPAVQGAQVVMGNALKSLGRFPEAVSLLEEAARGNPNDPMPLCERDARDTCLSIYMQHFASPQGHPYAYDLSELGRYYRAYLRLTHHWRDVLGSRIHAARYQDMVENPEPSIRALVAHCGLEWDERCMQHTENARPVSTLSAWQARQPIYRTSIGRWRRFEDDLGELLAALGDDA